MAERKKIIFPYYHSYFTSTAVIIYQTNLLKTLKLLPEDKKPHIYIWYSPHSPLDELRKLNYPYMTYVNIKSLPFRLRKLTSVILERIGLTKWILFNKKYDCIYPAYEDVFLNGVKRRVYWKADFQEYYFPEYFSKAELGWTNDFFENLKRDIKSPLVLSSHDALADFRKFFPEIQNPVLMFRFVSHISSEVFSNNIEVIKTKFSITKPYFIVCNQYWPHKNHIVVLEALKLLKDKAPIPFQVIFTGKTSSTRGSYFDKLRDYMQENNMAGDVVITDFVGRDEQILLMKNAIAIIQPTTFEGWSTVIEDAKALNQYVIASNIAVNVEQIKCNVSFFNPNDAEELASTIEMLLKEKPAIEPFDYNRNIHESIQDIVKLFEL